MTSHLLLPQQSLVNVLCVEAESCREADHGLLEDWWSHSLPDCGQADQELLQQSKVFDAGGGNWQNVVRNQERKWKLLIFFCKRRREKYEV